MNKKGVSPLVATVLLIVFAVGLGGIVMQWGSGYVDQKAEGACVGNVRLQLRTISGAEDICFDGNQLKYTIQNSGTKNIDGLSAFVFDNSGKISGQNFEKVLTPGMFLSETLQLNMNNVQQVVFQPRLKSVEGLLITCSKYSYDVENIPNC